MTPTLAQLGISTRVLIEMLHQGHVVVADSPVLGSLDDEGDDGESLHFKWETGEGDLDEVIIPHSNIAQGRANGSSLWIKDRTGEEVQISLYPGEPVDIEKALLAIADSKD